MSRELILDQWLNEVLKPKHFKRELLAGDASLRRYYRIHTKVTSYILMDAPPPEDPKIFSFVASFLSEVGLSVPKVIASDLNAGMLLLTDLGDRLYLKELNDQSADILYQDAMRALIDLHRCQAEVPRFDQTFLHREWLIFKDWFLKTHLKVELDLELDGILDKTLQFLIANMESQPFVLIHRDYHSRNLMILDNGNPGILDFQDAMLGPITYDLVSLLQDCYISWPRERVLHWVSEFKQYATHAKLITSNESLEDFVRWFDLTGVHRHLKNCGIFTRLHYRDGKKHYLKDLATPLKNIMETCERYAELDELSYFMKKIVFQQKM